MLVIKACHYAPPPHTPDFLSHFGIVVTGSHCAVQSDLELAILLPQLPGVGITGNTPQLTKLL